MSPSVHIQERNQLITGRCSSRSLPEKSGTPLNGRRRTAAGPDGIDVMSLIAKDPEGCLLANLFNSFLVRRKVPEVFKHNRSILLL